MYECVWAMLPRACRSQTTLTLRQVVHLNRPKCMFQNAAVQSHFLMFPTWGYKTVLEVYTLVAEIKVEVCMSELCLKLLATHLWTRPCHCCPLPHKAYPAGSCTLPCCLFWPEYSMWCPAHEKYDRLHVPARGVYWTMRMAGLPDYAVSNAVVDVVIT